MEIPSSSPVYTPLKPKVRKLDNNQLPHHQLEFSAVSESDSSSPTSGNEDVTLCTDSDAETVIESDEEEALSKSHKYLCDLLTDSVLEQLPLPPSGFADLKTIQAAAKIDAWEEQKRKTETAQGRTPPAPAKSLRDARAQRTHSSASAGAQ